MLIWYQVMYLKKKPCLTSYILLCLTCVVSFFFGRLFWFNADESFSFYVELIFFFWLFFCGVWWFFSFWCILANHDNLHLLTIFYNPNRPVVQPFDDDSHAHNTHAIVIDSEMA